MNTKLPFIHVLDIAARENWIKNCTEYLHSIYGDSIKGKTVVDYGFGRGNWSIAFQRLGAEGVISIDASQSVVDRFNYVLKKIAVSNVEARLANIDDAQIELTSDIVFLYGILSNTINPEKLLGGRENG